MQYNTTVYVCTYTVLYAYCMYAYCMYYVHVYCVFVYLRHVLSLHSCQRLLTIVCIRKIASHLELREDQLDIVLGSLKVVPQSWVHRVECARYCVGLIEGSTTELSAQSWMCSILCCMDAIVWKKKQQLRHLIQVSTYLMPHFDQSVALARTLEQLIRRFENHMAAFIS